MKRWAAEQEKSTGPREEGLPRQDTGSWRDVLLRQALANQGKFCLSL